MDDDAARHAETADSLAHVLHLLEKLSPVERAVFLLREVFDYPYEDIARIVGKTPENCRQILARAHRHVEEGRRRFDVSLEEREEIARRFIAAWEEGDTDALVELLAPDATVHGDGGGKAPAMPVPLVGAMRVAKALIGWGRQARERGSCTGRRSSTGSPASCSTSLTAAHSGWRRSRSPTASSSRSGRSSTRTSSGTCRAADALRPSVGFDLTEAACAVDSGGSRPDPGGGMRQSSEGDRCRQATSRRQRRV